MMIKHQKSSLLGALLVAYACSGGDGTTGTGRDGGADRNSADGTAWITGKWTGTYELKSETPDRTAAKAEFVDDDNDSKGAGTFKITLPEKDGGLVKGKFQDFANESLMLSVGDSSISTLGIPGSTTSVDYELIGNDLKIYNDRALLRLVRETSSADEDEDDDSGGGGGSIPDKGLVGRWACPDRTYVWRVHFDSETEFSIDIYSTDGGSASTWIDGTFAAPADTSRFDGMLTVNRAELDKYVGMQLGAKRASPTSLLITRLGTTETKLNCEPNN